MKKIFGFFFIIFFNIFFVKLINLNNQISKEKLKILNCNHLNFTQSSFLNSKNFKSFKGELVIDEWRKWQILTLKMRLIIKNLTNLQTEKDQRENCI